MGYLFKVMLIRVIIVRWRPVRFFCTIDEEMWPIGFKVERQDTDNVSSPEVLVDSL